jgi:hypothetical protein
MSHRPLLFGSVVLLAVAGCSGEELSCGSPPDLTGDWSYSGIQSAPPATLDGEMTLERDGTCQFSGTLNLTIDDGDGSPEMASGPVYGSFLDADRLELIAELDGEWTHAGTLVADTLAGDWAELGGTPASLPGSARSSAPRQAPMRHARSMPRPRSPSRPCFG